MNPIDVLRTNPKKFKRLVEENKVDVNYKDKYGTTFLHHASWRTPSLVEYLIQKGANVHTRNECGNTPLHWAESREAIELLLKHGADIHACNNHGHIPLQTAYNIAFANAVRVLYEHGSRVPILPYPYKALNEVIALYAGMCWKRSRVGGLPSHILISYMV
jgi:ankyrin repeat protein